MGEVINVDVSKIYKETEFRGTFNPGDFTWLGRKRYTFVKYVALSGTAIAGLFLHALKTTDTGYTQYSGTVDKTYGVPNLLWGQLQNAPVDGDFVWVQDKGLNTQIATTDGGVAAGDNLMAHASTDGGLDTLAGTATRIGTALADDSGTTQPAGTMIIDCGVD